MKARLPAAIALTLLAAGTLFFAGRWWSGARGPAALVGHGSEPFHLVEAKTLRPFTDQQLQGRGVTAVFFGFTSCPEVCPTTLATAGRWLTALGDDAARVRFVFITVDPERDTPERMTKYLSVFDARIVGATGARPEVEAAIKHFGAFAQKQPGRSDDDYSYDHTALTFLVGADGMVAGSLDFEEAPSIAVDKLRRLIRESEAKDQALSAR